MNYKADYMEEVLLQKKYKFTKSVCRNITVLKVTLSTSIQVILSRENSVRFLIIRVRLVAVSSGEPYSE